MGPGTLIRKTLTRGPDPLGRKIATDRDSGLASQAALTGFGRIERRTFRVSNLTPNPKP